MIHDRVCTKILVRLKHIRCLVLWECSTIMDLEMIMKCINNVFFEMGLDGCINLANLGFPTRARNLIKTMRKHRVEFIFDTSK
jgi:hypothetical protein